MSNRWVGLWLFLLWPTSAFAACVSVDPTGWPEAQRKQVPANAYTLAVAAGHDEFPTWDGTTLCFQTFDPAGVITAPALDAQYATDWQRDAEADSAQVADTAALATLDAQLADDTAWEKLTDQEKVELLRTRDVLKGRLGR